VLRRPISQRVPAGAQLPQRHANAPAPGEPLPSLYDRCFTCGPAHPTGLHMQVLAGEGISVRASFTVTEDHQGAPGLAHGGILASAVFVPVPLQHFAEHGRREDLDRAVERPEVQRSAAMFEVNP
jgi:hypothetical protein